MRNITLITEKLKIDILDFLYGDELFNVFLIHFIESQIEDLGELYISESDGDLNAVLHMKYDGNSYFTNFYYHDDDGLNAIAEQLKDLSYSKVLLAGRRTQVSRILNIMGKSQESAPDIYYEFDMNRCFNITVTEDCSFRRANDSQEDLLRIREFLVGFFQPTTDEETQDLINSNKLAEDLKTGIYFIEHDNEAIGMARFSGRTKNYADITTVYIDPSFRGKGFGKKLMECMIQTAILEGRVAVTQTSTLNIVARKTYESLGFIKQDDYSFEFI